MAAKITSPVLEVTDPWEAVEQAYEKGWTDGPPILPPTEQKVLEVLEYMKEDPGKLIGYMPPKHGMATIESIAVCCVMAGCKPQYMPVVVAALQAMMEDPSSDGGVTGEKAGRRFNLNGVIATANPTGPMLIVSGPAVRQLGLNTKANAMGGGARANVAIGRAIRLIIHIIGGGIYGEIDQAVHGAPSKYTNVIGEDPDANPWEPLHVTEGLQREQSAVTVFAASPHLGVDVGPAGGDPRRMLRIIGDSLATVGHAGSAAGGYQAVVLSPLVARTLADKVWTKRDIQLFLWENARRTIREFLSCGGLQRQTYDPTKMDRHPWIEWTDLDSTVPCVEDPDNFLITVCGADQQWLCAVCHGWGSLGGWPVTAPVVFPR